MIYLNSTTEFIGGGTQIYRTKEASEIWASHVSNQGDLIMLDQNRWHEGEEVTHGENFVLRSDIIYTKKEEEPNPRQAFTGHLGYIWKLLMFDSETLLSAGRDKMIYMFGLPLEIFVSL